MSHFFSSKRLSHMSVVAVVGGTGTVGRHAAATLRAAGAEVRVLHRGSSEHQVELETGVGLDAALAGCDVVLDASNGPPRRPEGVIVRGAARLVAAAERARVGHLVCVSIVGIELVPTRYYRAKLAQEQIVRNGDVPWSIVRSTQFHELVDATCSGFARWRVSPRSDARLQPVSALEAGRVLAGVALHTATYETLTVAGPETHEVSTLARAWCEERRRRCLPVVVPFMGDLGRALKSGALTCSTADVDGETSFVAWLRAKI
jgi:uncharacterized protein YbjT (DUF2867 family)